MTLDSDDYHTVVLILSAILKNDPFMEVLREHDLDNKKMVPTSNVSVKEYRTNYLAMIRELYRRTFFQNPCDYKRNPRDVHQRINNRAKYSDQQKATLKFVVGSDYISATEKFSQTLEKELFQDFFYIQLENNSDPKKIMEIPYSKCMI